MDGYNFTEDVRRILVTSREEANRLRHEYVGTEHILLAILHSDPCVAAAVLKNLGVDSDALRSLVFSIAKPGQSDRAAAMDLPYTSRAKKVLELAMHEARDLGHTYVGSEHLLLGLIREENGIAAQVLASVGVRQDNARAEVVRHPEVPAPSGRGALADHAYVAASGHPLHAARSAASPTPASSRGRHAIYAALSWGVIALGVLHTLATFRRFDSLTESALWFAGTGLLMVLAGALNLQNMTHGRAARGVRAITIVANVVLTAFGITAGIVGGASLGEIVIVVGLLTGTTILSLTT